MSHSWVHQESSIPFLAQVNCRPFAFTRCAEGAAWVRHWHSRVGPLSPLHPAEVLCGCTDSKAPFTFVVQLMVPGPPFLSLTMAWAADYDPAKRTTETPHTPEGHTPFAGNDGDSDSELVKSPFDLCLAR